MDTIFVNSDNSRTPKPHILILKIIDKLDLRIGKKEGFIKSYKKIKSKNIHKK